MAMKTRNYIIILLCLAAFVGPARALAQDEEDLIISPYMELKYLKNTKGQRTLNARIYDATDFGEKALPGLMVSFYTNNRDDKELLGEAVTGKKGIATYIVPADKVLPADEENFWWFYAEFEGKDNIQMAMNEVTVTDVILEMTLSESEEEGKMVNLAAYTMLDGEKVPLSDEEVYVFVPRMFSFLTIGQAYFEDGVASVEFPDDIPGDEHGKLVVIGRIEDHWQFGNVEKRIETNWGVPSSHAVAESHRALWTQIAPLWMIITLSVMLAGVWGHYLYAIICLFRIKKAGKGLDANKK